MKFISEKTVKIHIENEIFSWKYNLKQKQDLWLMLNSLQSNRIEINTYLLIITTILAFIFWYMLSVSMQNDMYKEMINQIHNCK